VRKIFSFHVTTVDGNYEGPDQEFDWPIVDDEFNQFALGQLDEVDTLMFGRVTHELMASYWPTPAAEQDDPKVAERMNSLPKLVVSRISVGCHSQITGTSGPARVAPVGYPPSWPPRAFGIFTDWVLG
jgi:hypothetical protein